MKIKTSITLSDELLKNIDRNLGKFKNRSNFIENAVKNYLSQLSRSESDRRDREIIDRKAVAMNKEAEAVLDFQVST
ncbi:MAG TPA: ribbon-helix-helix domain-containing protein [Kiritimatiellia bacterium]|nr:ribbon-helix-helix domain-containing protein [Kiritimatiellia bacterium]